MWLMKTTRIMKTTLKTEPDLTDVAYEDDEDNEDDFEN